LKNIFTNLIVAISGSEASISAAKYAILMAKQYQCRLTAAYVIDTATIKQLMMTKIFVPEESVEYEKSLEENGKRYLQFAKELAHAKGLSIETELRRGAISTEIMSCAEERKADGIVLGGWEKGRTSQSIISVAHREILYNASCTVIIVKEPLIDQLYKNAR
jgi:nucleotide-binding universal stress UspA family protein